MHSLFGSPATSRVPAGGAALRNEGYEQEPQEGRSEAVPLRQVGGTRSGCSTDTVGDVAADDREEDGDDAGDRDDRGETTPPPARPYFRLEIGDLPGLQAFFRELNRSLAKQFAASEAFGRIAQQQSEYIARVFTSSSVLANFNARTDSMMQELARSAMPLESYRRLAASAVANALPRDLVLVLPSIDTAAQVDEPTVVVENEAGMREVLGVRLDVMTVGLIVFWVYFLQSAIEALSQGDVDSFKNFLGVAIGCVYALSEYDKRQD